ncbi:hypothetical protein GOBAR_AA37738 [Gossypium barbadense]|uniref:Uncharacterized protein n=1 Tax=Gossypium barbadense TaxID=3634 RepID=A0A2P5VVX2_GOSBA|nr:hypothetical protein GOBAR_AA37738 [Gossypium barbadense]
MRVQSLSNTLAMRIRSSTCMTRGLDIVKQEGITDLSKWNWLLITVGWGLAEKCCSNLLFSVGSGGLGIAVA